MGIAREAEIVQLETLLAEVMSFADLDRNLLGPLQATIAASGTWLFAFGPGAQPYILGGSMAEAMRQYTPDVSATDPFQAYARTLPREAFLSNERNDFDANAYFKSAAYADFIDHGRSSSFRGSIQ